MSKTIVIQPGGYHPFHAGHYALYKSAIEAFPDADVYVAATNDQSERPFPFAVKEKLAKVAGVEPGHFVQVKSPFQSKEITQHYNPDEDVLIFVRSEKDRNESPKPGGTKKDGTPAYFQPYTGKDLEPFSQHAYFAYLPTVEFGPGITSATEIRKAWPTLDDRRKTAMVMSLYPAAQKNPKLAQNIVQMMDIGMGSNESVSEARGLAPVSPYVELMQSLGWFISAQTAKIAQDAIDNTGAQELKTMQQQFNKPMLNGKSFADVVSDPTMFKNPKVAPVLLKYAYEMLNYIEPRIKKYIRPELQSKWLGSLGKLKDQYRAAVQQTSGQQGVSEGSESSDNLVSTLNSFGYYSDNGSVYVNDNGEKIARQGSHWKHQSGKLGNGAEELGNFLSSNLEEDKGPCWTGYKQIGMKKKNGKSVPNCVPNEGKSVHESTDYIEEK